MKLTPLITCGLALSSMFAAPLWADDGFYTDHQLLAGKPFEGASISILSVQTPQFTGLQLRSAAFTALTGIKTEWTFVPFSELKAALSTEGETGAKSYDVVNFLDSWGPANAFWLEPLDEYLELDGLSMDRYPEAFARSAQFENWTLGLPLRAHAQLMFYRKDLIEEPPKSWADVIKIGQDLKSNARDVAPLALYYGDDGNLQNLFIWINFLWAAGEEVFDENGMPAWDTEAGLSATEDYIALQSTHQVTTPTATSDLEADARKAFAEGRAAMIPVWWWAYAGFADALGADQVGFVGMPAYRGETKTYAISMPFGISEYTDMPEASWEFLKWLSNPDMDRDNAIEREVGGTAINNNVVTHISSLRDAQVNAANGNIQAAAWQSLERSGIMPQTREWPEIGALLSTAIAEAARGGDTRLLMSKAAADARDILLSVKTQ